MKYLIDSDVLIDYFKGKAPVQSLVEHLLETDDAVAISVLSITELRTGWTEEQADYLLPRLAKLFTIEAVVPDIATQAGVWRHTYRTQEHLLGTVDTIIAATAYCKQYCLLTNNMKDYPMPEVQLYKELR
jgi:predicted nucleic acid-binding protein